MVNYTTDLKLWGSSGEEYPSAYSYVEGEQPVDAWDNFFAYNVVNDLEHLIDVTNNELVARDGSVDLTADLNDDNGVTVWDYSEGAVPGSSVGTHAGRHEDGGVDELSVDGLSGELADPQKPKNHLTDDGGAVLEGDAANIYTEIIPDGNSLYIDKATFIRPDGTPVPSGADLVIATLDGSGSGTSEVTVLSGDGSTVFSEESGSPLSQYTNSSGSQQPVMVAVDNGEFNAGSGNKIDLYAAVEVRQV